MTTTSIVILVAIGLVLVAAYGRDYHDDSLRSMLRRKNVLTGPINDKKY